MEYTGIILRQVITTILLLLILPALIAQKPLNASEKTEQHILIPGTNIHLVPAEGFELSKDFKGLAVPEESTTMVMIMEIPGPYEEIAVGFTKEGLAAKGMTLENKREVTVGSFTGTLAEISQDAGGMSFSKVVLLYGNSESSTMINGMCLAAERKRIKAIKACIESLVLDEALEVDPRAALTYIIDETKGNLVFNAVMGESMLFNRDGKRPTESKDLATVLTSPSYAKNEIIDKNAFCLKRLENYPEAYRLLEEKGINPIEVDGLQGFELFAKNLTKEGEEAHQIILFEADGGYYVLLGTYLESSEEAKADVASVMKSFRRR